MDKIESSLEMLVINSPESVCHPLADEMRTLLALDDTDSLHTLAETRVDAYEKEWVS